MSRPRALPLKRFLAEGRELYTQGRVAAGLGVGANYFSEVMSGLRPVPKPKRWVRFLLRRFPQLEEAEVRRLLGLNDGS